MTACVLYECGRPAAKNRQQFARERVCSESEFAALTFEFYAPVGALRLKNKKLVALLDHALRQWSLGWGKLDASALDTDQTSAMIDGINGKDDACLAGSIGSEIVRKLSEHNAPMIICFDFSESALYDLQQELKRKYPDSEADYKFILGDVRDQETVQRIFEQYQPNFVYHAAAYKHVPLMEEFPWQAVHTNVMATWQLVKLSTLFKVEKFVFISSDKAVNPTSVMGATKRLAEIIVQAFSSKLSATRFVITRFGNVLGSNGSVVPLFKKQIQEGGPVTVTHPDMIRYFMTISEACLLVLEASAIAEGGEVFVFDMGKPVKIVELAKNMIRLAGYIPDVDMKIEFIGQRPGEKLYEDLFLENEEMKETHHEKIMISKESPCDFSDAENIISKLQSLASVYDPELYKIVIKDLLPNFRTTLVEGKLINITSPGKKMSEYNYQN